MADNTTLPGTGDVIASDDIGGIKYQRVKATFGADGTATDVSLSDPLPVNFAGTTFVASASNNTTAQLAAGAAWAGGVEYAYSQPAAQVTVLCDKPYTVTLNQFLDAGGTKLEATYSFSRAAGVPFNENIKIPGDYFQVAVSNNGSTTTTTLNVTTSYGPMETLPNTLSNGGNLRVSIQEATATVPTNDEQITLLRRIVKLMESQATVDGGNRQRITVDAITGALTLATVTTVSTVTAVTAITNALPAGTNTVGNVTVGGMDNKQFIDFARTAYNTGIRSKLTFS